jgi:hypothetical protein
MYQAPVELANRNPFSRTTPFSSYNKGFDLFAGIAAEIGLAPLKTAMADFYRRFHGVPATTAELLSHLLVACRDMVIMDYFFRYVYGFDSAVYEEFSDLRIDQLWSQQDDSSVSGWEQVEAGQDNWFYATVRNAGTEMARAFVVTFSFKSPFQTPVYPADFRDNIISAAVDFELAPGATTTVKARWPREMIPAIPPGATQRHGCILAEVYTPEDHVAPGVTSIGASGGKLRQRNTDVVDLLPDETVDYFVDLGNYNLQRPELARFEIVREARWQHVEVSLHHPNRRFLEQFMRRVEHVQPRAVEPVGPAVLGPELHILERTRVELALAEGLRNRLVLDLAPGSSLPLTMDAALEETADDAMVPPDDEAFMRKDADWVTTDAGSAHLALRRGVRVGFPLVMQPRDRTVMNVKVKAPRDARPGDKFTVKFNQRNKKGELLGEFDVTVNVVARHRG